MCDVVWKFSDGGHARRGRNSQEEIGADKLFLDHGRTITPEWATPTGI